MTHTRYAFIKASWHSDIVNKAFEGFCSIIPSDQIDVFEVPGAFEMPLVADDLAATGKYSAIAAAAFVVDGGIYRHDTPHQYQETDHHNEIYQKHFIEKGKEAAHAALKIVETRASIK